MLSALLKARRLSLGISQVKLSGLSGVSLPTIQNIEMDKANPCYATLNSLCTALNFKISIDPILPDLDLLIQAGLPLTGNIQVAEALPSSATLSAELIKLSLSLQSSPPSEERLKEATQGFLLAIQSHFPSWYKAHLSHIPAVTQLLPAAPTGRMIKFSRQSREKLSRVL